MKIIDITDDTGAVIAPDLLRAAEAVHRELRPQLPADYVAKMHAVFAGGGRMCVAVRDGVVGAAVHRTCEKTFAGRQMYVDDLVTLESERSTGVGRALLTHLQELARRGGCREFTLDSGTQRTQAHKFYFREGLVVSAFHFTKPLA